MQNHKFESVIQYEFHNKELLNRALTHSSYCREKGLSQIYCNERLEFLGDAYLDAICGMELFVRMEKKSEGQLTKTRATCVCESALAEVGNRLSIGSYLNLGRGEAHSGGRHRNSIVADAMEAVIGAIFLDGGYEETKRFVLREFASIIDEAVDGKRFQDYKTQVQEILQRDGSAPEILYVLDHADGPDHAKTFYVHLTCDGRVLGAGSGRSKKEAEQLAAKNTIDGGYL